MTTAQLTTDWIDSMSNNLDDARQQYGVNNVRLTHRLSAGGPVYDVQASIWGKPHKTMGTLINHATAERLARALAERYGVPYIGTV